MSKQILDWLETNQLVCITTVQKRVGRRTIFGRILQVNAELRQLLIYDDDQKMVHHIDYHEIDDITPSA